MSRKKRITAAAALLALAVLFSQSGCSGLDTENKNMLELKNDGSIRQIIVDDVSGDITGEELENYINDELDAFQDLGTGESISLETCRVKDGKVNVTLHYSTVNSYALFNHVKCFLGTVKDAYNAGYDLNRSFEAVNGASVPYFMLPSLCTDCKVLILEENVTAKLPGELFLFSDGIAADAEGLVTVQAETDISVPELFQTTTVDPVFMIYKEK